MKVSEILKNIENTKREINTLDAKRVQLLDQKLMYEMQLEVLDSVDFEFTAAYELVTSYLNFNVVSFTNGKPFIYTHHLNKVIAELSKGNTTYLNDKNYLYVWEDNGICCDTFTRGCGPRYGTTKVSMKLVKPIEDGIILTLIKAIKVLLRDENLEFMADLEKPIDMIKLGKFTYKIYS